MSDQLKASIVRIIGKDTGATVGAGFLISDKHILTCAHVVAQALDLRYDTPELPSDSIHLDFPLCNQREVFTSRVVYWLPVQSDTSVREVNAEDIAGLELVGIPPETASPSRLVVADDLWGHSFRAFGFPVGYDKGVWASGVLRDRQAAGWVQIEDVKVSGYPVMQGFSGTPVSGFQPKGEEDACRMRSLPPGKRG